MDTIIQFLENKIGENTMAIDNFNKQIAECNSTIAEKQLENANLQVSLDSMNDPIVQESMQAVAIKNGLETVKEINNLL